MDREKQIEEMTSDLVKYSFFYNGNCLMNYSKTAKFLYQAGYCKQSDVVREIFGEILLNHTPDIDGFFTVHESELTELKKKYMKKSGNDR